MSEPSVNQTDQRSESESTGMDSFTLQVVSPSVGVPSPISFHRLPIETTVRQLKEKIREQLSNRPTNEAQRLIHRGRLLGRDDETMATIFGQETVSLLMTW